MQVRFRIRICKSCCMRPIVSVLIMYKVAPSSTKVNTLHLNSDEKDISTLKQNLVQIPGMFNFKRTLANWKSLNELWCLVLMSCFRGQRGLAESQKKELAQTPVLISCADQWNSAAVMRSHNMDIGNGALFSSMVTPSWRETWSGSFGHTPPSPCGEFAWARVLLLPAPCYLSVSPEAFLWFEGGCLSELLSPPLRCSVRACGRNQAVPQCMASLIQMVVMGLLYTVLSNRGHF